MAEAPFGKLFARFTFQSFLPIHRIFQNNITKNVNWKTTIVFITLRRIRRKPKLRTLASAQIQQRPWLLKNVAASWQNPSWCRLAKLSNPMRLPSLQNLLQTKPQQLQFRNPNLSWTQMPKSLNPSRQCRCTKHRLVYQLLSWRNLVWLRRIPERRRRCRATWLLHLPGSLVLRSAKFILHRVRVHFCQGTNRRYGITRLSNNFKFIHALWRY